MTRHGAVVLEHADDVSGQGVPPHLGAEGADSAGQAGQAAHRGELHAHARGEGRAGQGAPNTGERCNRRWALQSQLGTARTGELCLSCHVTACCLYI